MKKPDQPPRTRSIPEIEKERARTQGGVSVSPVIRFSLSLLDRQTNFNGSFFS